MDREKLKHHIYGTYVTLRYGLAGIAVFFPMLLYVGGRIEHIDPQSSMSHYYFASATGLSNAPMRVWFVGLLFAIGTCLILYKGFGALEDWLLNAAGASAACVALFPMPWDCGAECPNVTIHGISATILFLCIAAVSIFCARDTLPLIVDQRQRMNYRRKYHGIGAVMIATPMVAFAFSEWIGGTQRYVFAIEAVGIWVFAYYWWTKSRELGQSDAELRALNSEFET